MSCLRRADSIALASNVDDEKAESALPQLRVRLRYARLNSEYRRIAYENGIHVPAPNARLISTGIFRISMGSAPPVEPFQGAPRHCWVLRSGGWCHAHPSPTRRRSHKGVRSCFFPQLPSRAGIVSGGESPSRPDCSIPQPSRVQTRGETGSGIDSCLESSARPSLDLRYWTKRSEGQESRPDSCSSSVCFVMGEIKRFGSRGNLSLRGMRQFRARKVID